MKSKFLRTLAVSLIMLAILFFFTFPLWSSHRLLYQGDIIDSDVTELNFPARYLLGNSLKNGSLPFWNPYVGCGFPTMMEGQGGVIYPPNLLLFSLLSPVAAFNASVIMSLLLSLLFCYLLCRLYKISTVSAIFAAVAFTFSGFLISKLKFTYMINSMCWLPLAAYGVESFFSKRRLPYLLLTTLALAMQLLAGGPQIFYITGTLVLFISLWRLVQAATTEHPMGGALPPSRSFRGSLIKALTAVIVCTIIAVALAAPQLFPQLQGFPLSERSMGKDFSWSFGSSMRPESLSLFFSPFQHGNPAKGTGDLQFGFFWENVTYPGLLTMVLALISLLFLARRKPHLVFLWTTAALLALAISLGPRLPLAQFLWKYVPGFRMFRFWQRYLVVTVLSIAILAGLGLDLLKSRFGIGRLWRTLLVILVFAVLLIDLGHFTFSQVTTVDTDRLLKGNRTAALLKELLSGEEENYRIAVLGQRELWKAVMKQAGGWLGEKELFYQYMELLPPNHNILFGLSSFSQYGDYGLRDFKVLDSLLFWVYERKEGWRARMTSSAINFLALSSVKYLITPFQLHADERYQEIASIPTEIRGVTLRIYELKAVKPRAYLACDYQTLPRPQYLTYLQIVRTLAEADKTENRILVYEGDGPSRKYDPATGGEARIIQADAQRVVVEVNAPAGGILVLNDSVYPEWEVTVDGEKREMFTVNHVFRGVEVAPGERRVEFVYRSTFFPFGLLIAAAAALVSILLLVESKRSTAFDLTP